MIRLTKSCLLISILYIPRPPGRLGRSQFRNVCRSLSPLRELVYNTPYDDTDRETGLPDFGYYYQHDFSPIVEEHLGAVGELVSVVGTTGE